MRQNQGVRWIIQARGNVLGNALVKYPQKRLLMTPKSYLYLVLAVASLPTLPGCAIHRQAYFVSPFNGNNTEYHTLPTLADSTHSVVYSSLSFSSGSANDFGTDHFWSIHTSAYAAHQYGLFQFHYGLNLTLGDYTMGKWAVDTPAPGYYSSSANVDLPYAAQVNNYSGSHFFGGVGFQGGFNGVVPIGRAEWRFLGVETSLTQEFGNYLAVRRQMPDTIANLIIRDPLFATIGLNSEIVAYTREGEFGFRWGYGWALGSHYSNPGVYDNQSGTSLRYTYYNFSFHYTYRQLTAYLQLNEATKASGVLLGVNYRLWAGGKAHPSPEYYAAPR
jgi:hypothetical protein